GARRAARGGDDHDGLGPDCGAARLRGSAACGEATGRLLVPKLDWERESEGQGQEGQIMRSPLAASQRAATPGSVSVWMASPKRQARASRTTLALAWRFGLAASSRPN